MSTDIATHVRFYQNNNWSSKVYTYRSKKLYAKGEFVVVVARGIPTIARVKSSEENYKFNPGINYQSIRAHIPRSLFE